MMIADTGIPGVSGGECLPVPGQFYMTLALAGTPQRVSVSLTLNGAELATDSLTLNYRSFFPNGPACGGACQGASAELTISSTIADAGELAESGPSAADAGGQDN